MKLNFIATKLAILDISPVQQKMSAVKFLSTCFDYFLFSHIMPFARKSERRKKQGILS
jgi:hypothetical protein